MYFALFRQRDPALLRQHKQLDIGLVVTSLQDNTKFFYTKALLNSGATWSAINETAVHTLGIPIKKLPIPIRLKNTDGTLNANGAITEYCKVQIWILNHIEKIGLTVTNLENTNVFIRYDWLQYHNPEIDWVASKVKFT